VHLNHKVKVGKDQFVVVCNHIRFLVGILQMDLLCIQKDNCILDCDFAFDKLLELHMYRDKVQRISDSRMLALKDIRCLKRTLVYKMEEIQCIRKYMSRLRHRCFVDIVSWNHMVMDCKD
jgi:hypothetical protein